MALRAFLLTVVCASALAACSSTAATGSVGASCDAFRSTPVIEQSAVTTPGGDLQVVLCANASTGYAWDEPVLTDASVVRVADRAYRATADAGVAAVGAAGTETFTLHGLQAGSTTFSLRYSQPWPGGTKGEWTYRLSVTVRSL
jgi:predicted secreted protein